MFDGWELLQRLLMAGATPPLGASGGQMWRLMLVACMMIAARQNASEILAAVPTYDVVSLNTGYSAESIVNTEQNVHLVLGNDATAVSALRVCQVLLERLGGQHQEPRQQALLGEDLQAMVYKVSCSSSMFRVQPSSIAQALVYCLRKKRGLVPLWPAALVQLTGIYDPTVGDLGLVMQQLVPLLGLDEAAQQPPAAAPPAAAATAAASAPPTPAAATPAGAAAGGAAAAAAPAPAAAVAAAGGAAPAGPEGSAPAPAAAAGGKPAALGPESSAPAGAKAVEAAGPAAPAAAGGK
jgi:pyruvate/2-oxoglutarate dehydrogenase complex dihydrolipoamide acyltransferase (E2) component